jgi:diaminohydroxyphosphoribosylaminopyrimidine deaminase/5-amino-6-(5-phosphoribosylamino)uracil reductase
MDDKKFMQVALDLAQKGKGFTSPNPMVGAVVVRDGRIIGKGYHEAAGKPHAEVMAINDAGESAQGANLYVTLEPCNHTGRTPPCTDIILTAGIRRVITAMRDPNPDVKGGGLAYLSEKGIEVATGICEASAIRLNEAFIKYTRTKQPFVIVKCAATLDGRIATRTGDSKWVSGEASRAFVHELRHAADAIMVGVGTVNNDNPSLTTRIDGFKGKDPLRIIVDTHLSISEEARVLNLKSDATTTIVTGPLDSNEKKDRLAQRGAHILTLPLVDGRIDLKQLSVALGDMGVTSILMEGGGGLIGSALRSGIVDKIQFFYAPKILGGDDGVPICRGEGPDLMENCVPIKDVQVHRIGPDIMVEGYVGTF